MDDVLTTGQVAKLLHVAPRTVCKWCDAGMLISHRVPGTAHRRVLRADLLEFARAHEMPEAILEGIAPCSRSSTTAST